MFLLNYKRVHKVSRLSCTWFIVTLLGWPISGLAIHKEKSLIRYLRLTISDIFSVSAYNLA